MKSKRKLSKNLTKKEIKNPYLGKIQKRKIVDKKQPKKTFPKT